MKNTILLLLFAWTFGSLLSGNLKTGQYLAAALTGTLPAWALPAMLFVTSCLISAATGSSWGTIAIMFPIAVPMVVEFAHAATPATLEAVALLFPALGGILSGSLAGAQTSPISDTIITASTSTACYPIDHLRTQLWYIAPVIFSSAILFCATGLIPGLNPLVYIAAGLALCFSILSLCNIFLRKQTV